MILLNVIKVIRYTFCIRFFLCVSRRHLNCHYYIIFKIGKHDYSWIQKCNIIILRILCLIMAKVDLLFNVLENNWYNICRVLENIKEITVMCKVLYLYIILRCLCKLKFVCHTFIFSLDKFM